MQYAAFMFFNKLTSPPPKKVKKEEEKIVPPSPGVIKGYVHTPKNEAIPDVKIRLNGKEVAKTAKDGVFSIYTEMNMMKGTLDFLSDKYSFSQRNFEMDEKGSCSLDVILLPLTQVILDSKTGGSAIIPDAKAKAEIPPEAFITEDGKKFTGKGAVNIAVIDATNPDSFGSFPGDFSAYDETGKEVMLESAGAIYVDFRDSETGKSLNFSEGKSAQISFPVSDSSSDIPFWKYNPTKGKWDYLGYPGSTSGGIFTSNISSGGTYNKDRQFVSTTVSGRITNNSMPLPYAEVSLTGVNYNGKSYANTRADGTYSIQVKPGSIFEIKVTSGSKSVGSYGPFDADKSKNVPIDVKPDKEKEKERKAEIEKARKDALKASGVLNGFFPVKIRKIFASCWHQYYVYDLDAKTTINLTKTYKYPFNESSVIQMGDHVFITGGNQDRKAYEIDYKTYAFTEKAPMIIARTYHSQIAITGSSFMAIGTYSGEKLCEQYNINENKWVEMPSLVETRYALAVALTRSRDLYAIGGNNITSIERLKLSIEDSRWELIDLVKNDVFYGWGPGALPLSDKEILIFSGRGNSVRCIFNIGDRTVIQGESIENSDYYGLQYPCLIWNNIYILDYAHNLSVYRTTGFREEVIQITP